MGSNITISQSPDAANLIIYPTGDSNVNLVKYGQSNNYECVDEIWHSPNEDTDYVSHAFDSTVSDWYTCTDHATESGTINYVRVIARMKSHQIEQTTGEFHLLINDGVSAASSNNLIPIKTSYKKYYNTWDTKPSGGAWAWTDIDNMLIGLQLSSPSVTKTYSEALRPNSDVAGNGSIDKNGDTTWYGCVDEATADEDTTSIDNGSVTASIWDNIYRDFGMTDMADSSYNYTINNVKLYHRAKDITGGAGQYTRLSVRNNGSTTVGSTRTNTANYKTWNDTFTTNPDTSGAWSTAGVDSMTVRMDLRAGSHNNALFVTQVYATANYTVFDNPALRATQLYAVVNYTPATSYVSLSMPDQLSVNHSRGVGRFNFPDGDYEIIDTGRSGKALNISGIETSGTVTDMQSLKNMCHYGNKITIAGLPDTNLNTDYLIRGFTWNDMSYNDAVTDRTYRYSLQLEEV